MTDSSDGYFNLAWSPDGKRIAFLDEAPAWLDHDHLLFQSTQTGAFEVWVMQADGWGARRITK